MQAQSINLSAQGKIPPQAIDLEEALIGALLIESTRHDLIPRMKPEMFYKESSQVIFKAIQHLYTSKKAIDILTVSERLMSTNELEQVGGATHIAELTDHVSSSAHAEYHYYIVVQKYILRRIIQVTSEVQMIAFQDDDQQIEECQRVLHQLDEDITSEIIGEINTRDIFSIADQSINNAIQRMTDLERGIVPGIPCGIGSLHTVTSGWQKQDLIYIAARPSMGKTAVAIHFAKHAAKKGYRVLFFSLEMSDVSIIDRAILGETDINPTYWKNGQIGQESIALFESVMNQTKTWSITVSDKSSIRPDQVHAIAKKESPDIIFIDYIQLMKPSPGSKYQNRNLELGSISHDLKAIAKDFNIPVVALSQLNRDIDHRGSKIPTLSDIRDSGELEQDADVVIFPYRPEVYSDDQQDKGVIQFIIAKHRNGETGIVDARHNRYMNNFFDENQAGEMPF